MFYKAKYIVSCIMRMGYKQLFQTVNTVSGICGKNKALIFFDIVYCGVVYGAGYRDYLLFEFYNLTKNQRQTYVTRGINNTITKRMNDRDYYHIFDNKDEFYSKFQKYVKREWLFIPQTDKATFNKFIADKETVIAKPSNESCGVGVEKISKSDYASTDSMYEYLLCKGSAIVEEVIPQHDLMNMLNPSSVNTLRIVTVFSGNRANVIYGFVRIGNSERPVDNINAGGMCAPIDIETGTITHVAYDKDRKTYEKHPVTGCPIEGFQIPMWHQALSLCRKAAKEVPQMGYVGWDVAITPEGPVLVEGNNLPGHDILQLPPHVPDKVGMLPRFKMYVKGI